MCVSICVCVCVREREREKDLLERVVWDDLEYVNGFALVVNNESMHLLSFFLLEASGET
jgi:hypothetical protein